MDRGIRRNLITGANSLVPFSIQASFSQPEWKGKVLRYGGACKQLDFLEVLILWITLLQITLLVVIPGQHINTASWTLFLRAVHILGDVLFYASIGVGPSQPWNHYLMKGQVSHGQGSYDSIGRMGCPRLICKEATSARCIGDDSIQVSWLSVNEVELHGFEDRVLFSCRHSLCYVFGNGWK